MISYYFHPLPDIPNELLGYCDLNNYSLSLKKKYIIAQLIDLRSNTDIDTIRIQTAFYCNGISKSSIYQLLQWMIAHDLVRKTINDIDQKVFYTTNFAKLNAINRQYSNTNTTNELNNLSLVY